MNRIFALMLTLFLAACSGGGHNDGTTSVTISLGSSAAAVTSVVPNYIQSMTVTAYNNTGSVLATATTNGPVFIVTLSVPNGNGIYFIVKSFMSPNGTGVISHMGKTAVQTLTGAAISLPIQMNLHVAVTPVNPTVLTNSTTTFTSAILGVTPPATSPVVWSATDNTGVAAGIFGTPTANGASITWTAPAVAGTYTISADINSVVNINQVAGVNQNQSTITVIAPAAPDTIAPAINLIGATTVVVPINGVYTELGATSTDNVDGNLTASIVINATAVNTAVVGVYQVRYTVSDAAGNQNIMVRNVIVSAPISKTWNGSVDTLWSTPANWTPTGIPVATDNVLIPAAPANQPVLTVSTLVNDLIIETGAIVDTVGFSLSTQGNTIINGSVTGNAMGFLSVAGGGTIQSLSAAGLISNLNIINGANVRLTGPVNVTWNTTIFGGLIIAGQTFNTGILSTFSGSATPTLMMQSGIDIVNITGNATFNGQTTLTGGTLTIGGNIITAPAIAIAFQATGTHKTILNGAAVQNIDMPLTGGAGGGGQGFQNLQINNPTGVTVTNQTNIDGNLDILGTTAINFPGVGFTVKGNFTQAAGTSFAGVSLRFGGALNFTPGATFTGTSFVLDNATVAPQILPAPSATITYGTLIAQGSVKLAGATTLTRLDLLGQPAINLNGFNLTVNGMINNASGATALFVGTGQSLIVNDIISGAAPGFLNPNTGGITFDNVLVSITGPTSVSTTLNHLMLQNYANTATPLNFSISNWAGTLSDLKFYSPLSTGFHIGGTGTNNAITIASTNVTGTTDPAFSALPNNVTWPAPAVPVGTTHVWTGATNTSWGIASNWDVGAIPTATSIVFTPAAPVNQPAINNPRSITGFANEPGSTLTLGWSLTVANAFTNNGTIDFGIQNGPKSLGITGGRLTNVGTIINSGGGVATINAAVLNNGTIRVNAAMAITGLLSGFTSQTIIGNGTPTSVLTVTGGVSVTNVIVDNTVLEINVIAPVSFTNVTFQNYLSTATPFLLGFSGLTATFSNLIFNSPLTTGKHIGGLGTGNVITINGTNLAVGTELLAPAWAAQITWTGQPAAASSIINTLSSAGFLSPAGLSVDAGGNVFIADKSNNWIKKITTAAVVSNVAGTGLGGGFAYDGTALATTQLINSPGDVAVDASGNLYIADTFSMRIHKVNAATGKIRTIIGTGTNGSTGDGGDASLATLNNPWSVSLSGGYLFIVEWGNTNVRSVNLTTNIITTIPVAAGLLNPQSITTDNAGSLLIADTGNCRIIKIITPISAPILSTVLGTSGFCTSAGDGGPASAATIAPPEGVEVDSVGNIYITDATNHVIRMVDAGSGIISRIAGTVGTPGYTGDGGSRLSSTLNLPSGITVNSTGTVLFSERGNNAIRKFTSPSASAGITPVAAVTANPGVFWSTNAFNATTTDGTLWDGTQFVSGDVNGRILTSPTGATWTIQTQNSGKVNKINDMVFGALGEYVAVGQIAMTIFGSNITTTPNWVNKAMPIGVAAGTQFQGVDYNGTNYIAVAGTVVVTSTFPGAWTQQIPSIASGMSDVACNRTTGQCTVVGSGGNIQTAPAGLATWTLQTSATANWLNGIIHTGTQYVAVGNAGTIVTSADGITWTLKISGTATNLSDVTWDGTQYIAVGTGVILTSPDAIAWTVRETAGSTMNSVASSGTNIVIGQTSGFFTSQ